MYLTRWAGAHCLMLEPKHACEQIENFLVFRNATNNSNCAPEWQTRALSLNVNRSISDRLNRPEFGHPALRGGRGPGRPIFPGDDGKAVRRTIDKELKVKATMGREPWSSGYGRRLVYWRSWGRIPTNDVFWMVIFSPKFAVKIVMFVWKDKKVKARSTGSRGAKLVSLYNMYLLCKIFGVL